MNDDDLLFPVDDLERWKRRQLPKDWLAIYVLRYPILFVLVLIWKAVAFIARDIGGLLKRRPATPKLITHTKTSASD